MSADLFNNGLAIEFRNVSYRFGEGTELISDLNLQVRRTETLVLLGRSGSGKTTTLKLINALASPTSGEILVEGRPTTQWDPIRLRRGIGYVIQDAGLFPHFTVERNVALVPKIENWPSDRIRKRVTELLQLVGLDANLAARYPRELSGGQRQRVAIARALVNDPSIILADEPTAALDSENGHAIMSILAGIARQGTRGVLVVTHDPRILPFADRIIHIEDGRIVRKNGNGGASAQP